jgi:hypothetical protein
LLPKTDQHPQIDLRLVVKISKADESVFSGDVGFDSPASTIFE